MKQGKVAVFFACFASSAIAQEPTGQGTQTFRVAGSSISVESPKSVASTYATDVLSWNGWGDLKELPKPIFAVPQAADEVIKYKIPDSAYPVRIKFLIHAHLDTYGLNADRLVRIRQDMESPQVAEALKAIARLPAAYAAATYGKIRIVPDVEVFDETAYYSTLPGAMTFEELRLKGRTNAGTYQAEDGVYRGPYLRTISIAANSALTNNESASFFGDRTFDGMLMDAVKHAIQANWGGIPTTPIAQALAFGDTTTEQREAFLINREMPDGSTFPEFVTPFEKEAIRTPNVELTLESAGDGSSFLHYKEQALGRYGGASLPRPAGEVTGISFQVRSTSKEPIAIRVGGVSFTLGRGRGEGHALPFVYDGTWQTVVAPVPYPNNNGLGPVTDFAIVAPPDSAQLGRLASGPIEADFRDFKSSLAAIVPQFAAQGANYADFKRAFSPETSIADRITLYASTDREVQLAAILKTPATTDKGVITQLLALTNSIDARIAEAATQKYVELVGLEEARPELVRIIKFGLTDYVRGIAALELAKTGDPATAGDILVLLANRTVQTRLNAAIALGKLPGEKPGIIRMAFLQQTDPAIKLAVTRSADPASDYQMRKLMWSAVNEPSDDVRLESAIKLIQSSNPTIRAEGYKVIRDDSWDVRRRFAEYLGIHPNEAHRATLQIAIVDRSPQVRVAALEALIVQPGGVKLDEVESLFRDSDPRVVLAILPVLEKNKWKAPPAWIELLKKSPVPEIKATGERLANGTNGGQ